MPNKSKIISSFWGIGILYKEYNLTTHLSESMMPAQIVVSAAKTHIEHSILSGSGSS